MTDSTGPVYSCITCRLLVTCTEHQREHYQSDWHRYNLKRKVASLPPLSLQAFLEKASAQNALLLAAESVKQQNWWCDVCRKQFSNPNQLDNHLTSKRHISLIAAAEKSTKPSKETHTEPFNDIEEVSDPEPLEPHECLFCPTHCTSRKAHLEHMYLSHGFFIPYLDYAQDVTGILNLLACIVGEYFSCVYCANRSFSSVEAAQHHMRDKSHCKLNPDNTDLFCDQFSAFYDFSTSYPDHEDATSSELPSETGLKLAVDMSLILPSGATAGHRAFRHIYRQNLRPSASRAIVLARPAVGSTADYLQKLRGLREIKGVVAKRTKQDMRLGVKANKLQPYFRRQC